MTKNIDKKLRTIIKKFLKGKNIDDNFDLAKNKVLDSLDFINLIFSIEDVFNIKFEDKDLNNKNFNNIKNILKIIKKKIER